MIQEYKVIGMMSGTSLDGLDLAYCRFFYENDQWKFKLERAETIGYTSELMGKLKNSVILSSEGLLELDVELGRLFGKEVRNFIDKYSLEPDFIASHGHTVFHQPHKGFTLQIGSPNYIYVQTGIPVVADFRSLDVTLGGQGAPLVPVGDRLLFSEYKACINLGGISNISFEQNGQRMAFDIGVCNMLLNHICQRTEKSYDEGGKMAKQGRISKELLLQFNQLQESKAETKFSLGYEWVSANYFPLLGETENINDLLATATEHVCQTLAHEIKAAGIQGKVLITGGGAFNNFLISRLNEMLGKEVEIEIPDYDLIGFKEAIIFGFLGVLKIRNEVNCLKSVTGAIQDSCSGVIYGE